jgi:hypothetical protein
LRFWHMHTCRKSGCYLNVIPTILIVMGKGQNYKNHFVKKQKELRKFSNHHFIKSIN